MESEEKEARLRIFLITALRFVNIIATAIVAGGQFYVLNVIVPVKRTVSARMSVQLHLAILGRQTDRYMKPTGIVSVVSALALIALSRGHRPGSIVLLVIGLLGMLGVVITSRYFNVPANREMAGWSLDALPEDYGQWRNRWDRVHRIRTACGLVALAGFVGSALLR
jgi:uncharacterized membrane protein